MTPAITASSLACRFERLLRPLFLLIAAVLPQRAGAEEPPAQARPPFWASKGFFLYRVSTPDAEDVLQRAEEGLTLTSNLLDGSVPQIPLFNGLVGHDHHGPWNWDGAWPYWNRVTFRAGNDWKTLAGFMNRIREHANAKASFHVNLTDVNIGLRDYPETRDFFRKLVETKSLYRRDFDPRTNRQDKEPPYVPQEIERYIPSQQDKSNADPVAIFALVNYKNFWESGLAKTMIDQFYAHLPYAPPVLYLDVFNLSGGNFSTGFPTGPLGGSEQTQLDGAIAITDYLRSKGTDLGTEGERPFLGNRPDGTARAGYVWYHGKGFSEDDYRVISGGAGVNLPGHHVFGNPGAFNVSPIALTAPGIEKVKTHYAALLAGKPSPKTVAGLETWHISTRENAPKGDEFDIPGTGDAFRGDFADLVGYFYLAVIQENYHIGKKSVRKRQSSIGAVHLGKYRLVNPDGSQTTVSIPDFLTDWRKESAQKNGQIMLEFPLETQVTVTRGGRYPLKVQYKNPNRDSNNFNVYVNGRLQKNIVVPPPAGNSDDWSTADAGEADLNQGVNTIAFDAGRVRATWSDGTVAEWKTPYLRKGFKAWNGDVVFAEDYDRMWPDTWSGQKKIYFFSWDGTQRGWKLPEDWADRPTVTLHALTTTGRAKGVVLKVENRSVSPRLLPQIPYILVP